MGGKSSVVGHKWRVKSRKLRSRVKVEGQSRDPRPKVQIEGQA